MTWAVDVFALASVLLACAMLIEGHRVRFELKITRAAVNGLGETYMAAIAALTRDISRLEERIAKLEGREEKPWIKRQS